MQRCLDLARSGAGYVAPNPMVGAVLVYDGRIIGEGWHQQFGGPHAEVNAIQQAIQNGEEDKLTGSQLYVSLEPCSHHGKTPPCTDLILHHKIPKVVIGCRDPFKEVDTSLNDEVGQGKGIEKLEEAGVEVDTGILEKECMEINKRFFTFQTKQRPYIILKWAQTADGKMAAPLNPPLGGKLDGSNRKRLLISNEYSDRLVHKWRSEEASILVGTNTAALDDPELTTRSWPGPSPVRLVVDMNLCLPNSLKLFDRKVKTIIFNSSRQEQEKDLIYYKLKKDQDLVPQLLEALHSLEIQSVLVEGGAKLLQSFIDAKAWDEIRTITNSELRVSTGLAAPEFSKAIKTEEFLLLTDKVEIYNPKESDSRLQTHDS